MSEAGGERIVLEKEAKVKPSPEYDHSGLSFRSDKFDNQAGLFSAKLTDSYKVTAIDAFDLVKAEIGDLDEQKKDVVIGRKEFLRQESRLVDIREILLDAYAGHEISPPHKDKIETYLDQRIARFDQQMQTKDEEARAIAETNKAALLVLKDTLLNPEAATKAAQELDGDETLKDVKKTEAEDQLEALETYPEYTYAPNIDKILDGFTSEEVTIEDLPKIFERFGEDVRTQEHAYADANPGWKEKKEAVGAANIKFRTRIEEVMADGTSYDDAMIQIKNEFIYASYNDARGASASWEKLPQKGGTKYYTFSLDDTPGNKNEANYFGTHLMEARYFETWREEIATVQDAMKDLEQFKESSSRSDEEALKAQFALSQLLNVSIDASRERPKDLATIGKIEDILNNLFGVTKPEALPVTEGMDPAIAYLDMFAKEPTED